MRLSKHSDPLGNLLEDEEYFFLLMPQKIGPAGFNVSSNQKKGANFRPLFLTLLLSQLLPAPTQAGVY
jgi:hypothetical protein